MHSCLCHGVGLLVLAATAVSSCLGCAHRTQWLLLLLLLLQVLRACVGGLLLPASKAELSGLQQLLALWLLLWCWGLAWW